MTSTMLAGGAVLPIQASLEGLAKAKRGCYSYLMKQISSGIYYSSSETVAGRTDQSAVQHLLRKGNEHTVCGSYAGYDWSFASPGERSATCQPCIDRATTPDPTWLSGEEEAARSWLEANTEESAA